MIPVKAYVQKNDRVLVVCPACGTTHELDADKFRGKGHSLKARCRCRNILNIAIDFRNQARKEVLLSGTYSSLDATLGGSGRMTVYNLSRTGIGFAVLSGQEPWIGQKLRLEFQLDDRKGSKIVKNAVVKSLHGSIVGCEFDEYGGLAGALGFYLQD